MKRYGGLWEGIIAWENLLKAARKAQRGKRDRGAVQAFNFFLEEELLILKEELNEGTYRPGAFQSHWISRPKPRMISVAPYRDRVVHHALMNVLEPILDRHFHPHSYACRKGKGTHAAADRLQALMKKYRYALQCDVRKFFPSIDHEILKGTFRRLIKDRKVLWLMDLIVDNSNEQEGVLSYFPGDDLFTPIRRRKGLPIGNLTSQWFANWMLTGLDHFVSSRLGIGAYVRYCDDFILLHDDKEALREARTRIVEKLAQARLELHKMKAHIRPVRAGLTFLGYRIWPTHRLLRKQNVRAFRRRVRWMKKAYGSRAIDLCDIGPRILSWMAHARHANSIRLIRRLSLEWRFKRDGADNGPGSPGRVLEQQQQQPALREPQQQQPRQLEQQQRVSPGPALSCTLAMEARSRLVQAPGGRGLESPGSVPVPEDRSSRPAGRIYAVRPGGSCRLPAESPARSFYNSNNKVLTSIVHILYPRRSRLCVSHPA